MSFIKYTEQTSKYDHLQDQDIQTLTQWMNAEDQTVSLAVQQSLPQIQNFISHLIPRMESGGRLFYIGAGTSGRLGILDASECPPTFGVSPDWVIGIIAGGDKAIRNPVEHAEDSQEQAMRDLQAFQIDSSDTVVGLAASGTTPYVVYGLQKCQELGVSTACITCNPGSPVTAVSNFPIEIMVGPEFVTGSTRLKSGTAQKMVLNMITTIAFIKLGRVVGNKMVDMQLTNAKLIDRGVRMIMEKVHIDYHKAERMLLEHGSVRNVLVFLQHK